jgi:hypothetical protein
MATTPSSAPAGKGAWFHCTLSMASAEIWDYEKIFPKVLLFLLFSGRQHLSKMGHWQAD